MRAENHKRDVSEGYRLSIAHYAALYPEEFTAFLTSLQTAEILRLLGKIPADNAAKIMSGMNPDAASEILKGFSKETFQKIVPKMDASMTASFILRLPREAQDFRLSLLPISLSHELRELMSYPADCAGAIMDPHVLVFKQTEMVKQAFKRLRKRKQDHITDIFVVDSDNRLAGQIPLQDLVVADPSQSCGSLCQAEPVSVHALSPRSEVVELLEQQKLSSIAVVDVENRLLGVIRYNTLISTIQEDATVDIQKMVGVSPEERALSKVPFSIKKRVPWLFVNLGTAFLAAYVVGLFESTIAKFTALAVLLPVVAGQSGNTGSQALAVIQRGLALREVRLRHCFKVVLKEGTVGLVNGIMIGAACAAAVYLWSKSPGLAMIIGSSMVIAMGAAGLAGAAIPMMLVALKQDPAQASSIILTTVTDVVGFLTFLGLATIFSYLLVST